MIFGGLGLLKPHERLLFDSTWHEDKHPRDEQGRFVRGEESILTKELREKIDELIDKAKSGNNENQTVIICEVRPHIANIINENIGKDISGYMRTIDMYAVKHAINRHSNEKIEKSRAQLPLTDNDIENAPDIINSPDTIILGLKNERKQDLIFSLKKIENDKVLILEEVRTGRRTLAVSSMRKFSAARSTDSIVATLSPHVRNDSGNIKIIPMSANKDK